MNDVSAPAPAPAPAPVPAPAPAPAPVPAPAHHTYVMGEDAERLQTTAQSLGLESARNPMANVRGAMSAWFQDTTLEAARMHSVGALGQDEHIDSHGTLHVRTLTHRKRRRSMGGEIPKYGTLQDLFRKGGGPIGEDDIEEDEEDVEEVIDTVEGGSLTAAIFGLIKGTVGPAILYLPRGFSMAGYAVAIVSMTLATCSYLYSALRLLQCWKAEKAKMEKLDEIRAFFISKSEPVNATTAADYGSIVSSEVKSANLTGAAEPKLLTYPELARRAFGSASIFVQFGIAAMQFGVCLTYFIFVPQNLAESVHGLFGVEVDRVVFLILMVVVEVPLSWIRDIRKLTPTNIMATFLIAYGLLSCLLIALVTTLHDPEFTLLQRIQELPPTNDTWYLFVGTSFFVFEGSITLLVPLQEAVFHKEDKERFPMVNVKVTSYIVAFYVFFAMTCWVAFGDSVKTALTASLPSGSFSTIVQFAYSVAVILTFPLQAFPALEVVFHSTSSFSFISIDDDHPWRRNTVASIITCLLAVVAYLSIDYLGNVVSLLGSLVGIPIALVYPPLMHNRLVKDAGSTTKWINRCVAGMGVVAMCAASFTTITSWDKGAE